MADQKPAVAASGSTGRKTRPYKHLTAAQRAECFALWRSGTMTLDQLAKRFNKDRTTLSALFSKHKVVKGSDAKATEEKVTAAVTAAIVDDAAVLANRIRETKEQHYKMNEGLAKLTWKVVVDASQPGNNIGSRINEIKALKLAADTIAKAREERFAVLGIKADDGDADAPLPPLTIQELTAADIERMNAERLLQAAQEDLGIDELGDMGDGDLAPADDDGHNDRVETE